MKTSKAIKNLRKMIESKKQEIVDKKMTEQEANNFLVGMDLITANSIFFDVFGKNIKEYI